MRPPVTGRFRLRGAHAHTERLAPGMEVAFDVAFDAPAAAAGPAPAGGDHHDSLAVASDAGTAVEVALHAWAPRAKLRLTAAAAAAERSGGGSGSAGSGGGDGGGSGASAAGPALLEFGVVPASGAATRAVALANEGSRPAHWKAVIEG